MMDTVKISENKRRISIIDDELARLRNRHLSEDKIRMLHGPRCMRQSYPLTGRCDCSEVSKRIAERNSLERFNSGEFEGPSVVFPVFFWPGFLIVDFIKSEATQHKQSISMAKELSEAKHDAELAELRAREAAALDKELALSRRRSV